jgi:hypothetical protein
MEKFNDSKKLRLFKRSTNSIINILCDTKDVFNYCKYFYQQNNSEELVFANTEFSIHIIRFTLWKQTIIELAKLFSIRDTDKFRISKYIDNLKPDGYYGDLKFPTNKILEYERKILSHGVVISNILLLRNKLYAHTDRIFAHSDLDIREYYNISISFDQIENLIKLLNEILYDVFGEVFNSDLDLSIQSDTHEMNILSKLVAYNKIKTQNLIDSFRKE